jgi:hypothetical protein
MLPNELLLDLFLNQRLAHVIATVPETGKAMRSLNVRTALQEGEVLGVGRS